MAIAAALVVGAVLALALRAARPPAQRPAPAVLAASGRRPVTTHAPPRPPALSTAEPHPITPERLRIDEQHELFDRVEAAIAAADFPRARALLRKHEERFPDPEAWTDLRRGWQVIADCLEHPGPEAQARAEAFVHEERGSSLRRRVRRTCLQPE